MWKLKIMASLACLLLASCSSIPFFGKDEPADVKPDKEDTGFVPSFIKPFKVDIQQGNYITEEDVGKLKIGMPEDQVRFLLGTPLLQDPFHSNRWDYIFKIKRAEGGTISSRYTVIFENGLVKMHGGENLPKNQADDMRVDRSNLREIKPVQPKPSSEAAQSQGNQPEAITGTETAPELK